MPDSQQHPVRFGIALKIALLATVLVVATVIASGLRNSATAKKIINQHEEGDLIDDANLVGRKFLREISLLREDTLSLAQLPEVLKLANLKPTDANFETTRQKLRGTIASKFKDLGEKGQPWDKENSGRRYYTRIRLIGDGDSGAEIVRAQPESQQDLTDCDFLSGGRLSKWVDNIHMTKNGKKEIEQSPHGVGDRDYYLQFLPHSPADGPAVPHAERVAIHPNRVYLSKVELNREWNESLHNWTIEKPYQPVIRAMVPLLDSDQKFFGIIIINLNLRSLIRDRMDPYPHRLTYVIEPRGQFIFHPEPEKQYLLTLAAGNEPKILLASKVVRDDPIVQFEKWEKDSQLYGKKIDDVSGVGDVLERIEQTSRRETGIRLTDEVDLKQAYYYLLVLKAESPPDAQTRIAISHWLCKIHEKYRPHLEQFPSSDSPNSASVKYRSEDPLFRGYQSFTKLRSTLRFRSGNLERLKEIQKDLEEQEWAATFEAQQPIECSRFVSHALRLYMDPNDHKGHYLDVVIAASYEEIESEMIAIDKNARVVFVSMALGGVCLAFLFSRLLTRPLKSLIRATRGFGAGRFDVKLPLKSRDEFGVLARAFENMIEQVSERSEAVLQQEARIRAILETAADGIMTVNEDAEIESFNAAAESIFGYTADEVIGKSLRMLYPLNVGDEFCDYLATYLKTGEAKMIGRTTETTGLRRDGAEFPLELAMSEVVLGDRKIFTSILRDVSERKQSEDELTELTSVLRNATGHAWSRQEPLSRDAPLYARVKEHTAAARQVIHHLEDARDRALAANRTKDSFLANMSHELRTPLTAIIGYSEYLERSAVKNDQVETAEDLRKILSAGKHLLAVIEDVLDLAKIEVGEMKLHLVEIDVNEIVDDVAGAMEFSARKNSNVLKTTCDDGVGRMTADAKRVRQILFNLLGNACKFTDNGRVGLEVSRRAERGRDGLQFRITDTGIGMTDEQIARLFKPFSQADSSTSRKYGGTGLGLAISRRFCTMMGGKISVTSQPGEGSVFTVWLPAVVEVQTPETAIAPSPVNDPAAPATTVPQWEQPDTSSENAAKPKILVIDDDPVMCELMVRQLGKNGFQVRTAMDPRSGLEAARVWQPDVITLDIAMPDMDGWEVATTLKSDERTKDIPIIMVTMMDDRSRGFALGAYDFITKPVEWGQLTGILETAVHKREPSTVLVIDDDPLFRESVCDKLRDSGWTVMEAENGAVAFERLAEQRPALILLDLNMPVMNGHEFLTNLDKDDELKTVPLVVMTGMDPLMQSSREQQQQLSDRAERILIKGTYDIDELLDTICKQAAASVD